MNRILVGVCFIIGFVIEIIRMAITDENIPSLNLRNLELSYYLDKIDLYLLFIYQYDK